MNIDSKKFSLSFEHRSLRALVSVFSGFQSAVKKVDRVTGWTALETASSEIVQ